MRMALSFETELSLAFPHQHHHQFGASLVQVPECLPRAVTGVGQRLAWLLIEMVSHGQQYHR